ncbi:MAG: hypothetical protein FWG65_00745 [Turicibacter sp.]|nr:hypothetical protein [Turicibacter sp.]
MLLVGADIIRSHFLMICTFLHNFGISKSNVKSIGGYYPNAINLAAEDGRGKPRPYNFARREWACPFRFLRFLRKANDVILFAHIFSKLAQF